MNTSTSTSQTQPVQATFSSEFVNKDIATNDGNAYEKTSADAPLQPHVDRSTQDITDAPNDADSYISGEFLAKFSSTMKDILREMSSPLRPPPPSLLSRSSKSSQAGTVEDSTESSSYSFCGSNVSSEADDASHCSIKNAATAHAVSADSADNLIDRLAFELQGQHTELQILAQSMQQRREMILTWLDNILFTARSDPGKLTAEIEDCVTAMSEWDSTAATNNREAEVKRLLNHVEQLRRSGV
ncbi:hypothetical protein CkaCkLH20_09286 [Colletotrichum karsti]|uniref:Uncharacterized protein n=1 Tax=Colletotrichum karsti TaxID=1095194 RepID=A0A9P6HYE2_9PEZI|nr:uncharacterized protein CkaCkLH20_09286 [Colletotrichum karsti]KAF9873123.1 hypothetical protein CkaCkLH20_09286 [Colletotrichum karsti]